MIKLTTYATQTPPKMVSLLW